MRKYLLVLYLLFLLLISSFSYLFIDPNFFPLQKLYSGFMLNHRVWTTSIYILLVLLFFIFYVYVLILTKKEKINIKQLKKYLLVSVIILVFAYPAMLSFDIFNYVANSKTLFLYHENPYLIMPIEFRGDKLLLFMHAGNKTALYGPSWILLSGFPYLLSFGNFLVNILNIKIVVAFFYLMTTFFIWKISKNIFSVVLFALNPLVLTEVLLSGHNDIVMMFFALFSFFCLIKKRILFAVIFLIISILIKYATLFLLPVFIYALFKTLKKENINWNQIFYFSSLSMILIFLLSPLREEIYPWYAIWFLTFTCLISNKKLLLYLSIALSFGLLLRYIPFMLLGTYFGPTPLIKIVVTFTPVIFTLLYLYRGIFLKKNV